jgi:hypothetical protein
MVEVKIPIMSNIPMMQNHIFSYRSNRRDITNMRNSESKKINGITNAAPVCNILRRYVIITGIIKLIKLMTAEPLPLSSVSNIPRGTAVNTIKG